MACLSLMTCQISAREYDQQDANKKIKDGRKQHKNNSSGNIYAIMNDLGLNLNIWNVDVKTNAIFFTNGIKQDFHSRENRLLKSIKTRLFLYLLNFILHLIEARSSHFAPFSSAICSLFHKISTSAFQLFKPKNTSFSYFYTFQS